VYVEDHKSRGAFGHKLATSKYSLLQPELADGTKLLSIPSDQDNDLTIGQPAIDRFVFGHSRRQSVQVLVQRVSAFYI